MSDGRYEMFLGCDVSEGASYGLLGVMCGISEENWCAGWMNNLALDMWQARNSDEDMRYGMGIVNERQRRLLRDLSEEAGGWWDYGEDGPYFIQMADWIARIDAARVDGAAA